MQQLKILIKSKVVFFHQISKVQFFLFNPKVVMEVMKTGVQVGVCIDINFLEGNLIIYIYISETLKMCIPQIIGTESRMVAARAVGVGEWGVSV